MRPDNLYADYLAHPVGAQEMHVGPAVFIRSETDINTPTIEALDGIGPSSQ
jgi:hypothetical protein